MRILIILSFILCAPIVKAEDFVDENNPVEVAEQELCESTQELVDIVKDMNKQKKIEAASGVKDLVRMRQLGDAWVRGVEGFTTAIHDPNAKNVSNCSDIPDADQLMVAKEMAKYQEKTGDKKGAAAMKKAIKAGSK